MDLLARREHTRKELITKLVSRDFAESVVSAVLDRLREENLQSDDRFAEAYVNMRTNKGYGPVRILQELQERGVSSELQEMYIDDRDSDWLDRIRDVREKKFGHEAPADYQASMKQARFLQYRGFTHAQIRHVLNNFD